MESTTIIEFPINYCNSESITSNQIDQGKITVLHILLDSRMYLDTKYIVKH